MKNYIYHLFGVSLRVISQILVALASKLQFMCLYQVQVSKFLYVFPFYVEVHNWYFGVQLPIGDPAIGAFDLATPELLSKILKKQR